MTDIRPEAFYIYNGVSEANNSNRVVAIAGDDPSSIIYLQYKDGKIIKWENNISYIADSGTLWADRSSAIYTVETI